MGLPLSSRDVEKQQDMMDPQCEEEDISRSEEERGGGQTWLEGVRRWGGRKRRHRRMQKSAVKTKEGIRGRKGESKKTATQCSVKKGRRRGGAVDATTTRKEDR